MSLKALVAVRSGSQRVKNKNIKPYTFLRVIFSISFVICTGTL